MTTTHSSKLHPLIAPIDVSKVKDEKGVKALIKRLLDFHGYFHWMPAANGYGTMGVSDHAAVKDGVFMVIEAKFGYNKPKPVQKQFAQHIMANSCYAFCVNEKNIDHFAWWLESFEHCRELAVRGQELPADHAARMINAIAVLTAPFADVPLAPIPA